jgi:hypothetical protein
MLKNPDAAARGQFVFFDGSGVSRYVLVASTIAETDAGLVVYCPDAITGADPCP